MYIYDINTFDCSQIYRVVQDHAVIAESMFSYQEIVTLGLPMVMVNPQLAEF